MDKLDSVLAAHWISKDKREEIRTALSSAGLAVVPVEADEKILKEVASSARDFYSESGPYPRAKAVYRAAIKKGNLL